MAEFSKEYYEITGVVAQYDFSIRTIFAELQENESVSVTCEGLGVTAVMRKNDQCHIAADGQVYPFEIYIKEKAAEEIIRTRKADILRAKKSLEEVAQERQNYDSELDEHLHAIAKEKNALRIIEIAEKEIIAMGGTLD